MKWLLIWSIWSHYTKSAATGSAYFESAKACEHAARVAAGVWPQEYGAETRAFCVPVK